MVRSRLLPALVVTLSLLVVPGAHAAPDHDNVADAAVIGALPSTLEVDTRGATDEAFEDSLEQGCRAHAGIWARFTPSATTTVIAVIDGSQRSAAALYEGADPESLRLISCMRSLDGRAGSSDGNLHTLEAGTTYHIRLSTAEDEVSGGRYTFDLAVASGITGRVRDARGEGKDGVLLWAYDGERRRIAAACSHSGGRYRVSGLPAGRYRLSYRVNGCGPGEASDTKWYGDADGFEDAERITVSSDSDTDGIDIRLRAPEPEPSESPSPSPSGNASPSESASPSATASPSASSTPSPSASEPGIPDLGPPQPIGTQDGSDGPNAWLITLVAVLGLGGAFVARRRVLRARGVSSVR